MATSQEADVRIELLNSFLKSPHNQLEVISETHSKARERDPLMYGKLSAWYFKNGEIRDHKVAFCAYLLASDREPHRNEGYMLLKELQPYEAARVLKWMKEHLNKIPRSARTAFVHYIHDLEKDKKRLERTLVRQRKAMKTLYASLHIKPCELSKQTLFDKNPPEGTQAFYLKVLSKSESSAEQAKLIAKHRIPFTIAVSAIDEMTPAILVALITTMSSPEVVNNIGMLKRYGAFENKEVKQLIEAKIGALKDSTRASTMKTVKATEAVKLDEETKEKLEQVTEERLKAKGVIKRPTALIVDKSGSMGSIDKIKVAKQLSTTISSIIESDFYIYAFDTVAYPIMPKGITMKDYDKAFDMIVPGGGTSIGAPIRAMYDKKQRVEQILIISDEEENTRPLFVEEYKRYAAAFGMPEVTIVCCGEYDRVRNQWRYSSQLSDQLKREKLPVSRFEYGGDYYALPNVISLLTKPDMYTLLEEIMATEVPMRQVMRA